MTSVFVSYIQGLAIVLAILLRIALEAIGAWFRRGAVRIALVLVLIPALVALAHYVLPGTLASWYAGLDQKKSPWAERWRAFDAFCSVNVCRHVFPSPVRHYELHVKEEVGFRNYLTAQKTRLAKQKDSSALAPAQRYVREFLPRRSDAYATATVAAARGCDSTLEAG